MSDKMKTIIITTLLTLIVLVGKAQSKKDTVVVHDTVYLNSNINYVTFKSDCRDTTIQRSRRVVLLVLTDFAKNKYQWQSAWQCWEEKRQIGKNCITLISNYTEQKYTYLCADRKTAFKGKIIDYRIL